jgi:hypothetical protein
MSCYYPYFRGKQNELIVLRENAEFLKNAKFTPIIEPVKEAVGGLKKTLDALSDKEVEVVVIVNPYHGDHSSKTDGIDAFFQNDLKDKTNISVGILLSEDVATDDVVGILAMHNKRHITLIHNGFTDAKALVEKLGEQAINQMRHVFSEKVCGKLYRRHFTNKQRVLSRDGFRKQANRSYPFVEHFSDLHVTYKDEAMDGFSDFLIVGNEYSENGGPAYAVAIHLTFIDRDKEEQMYVYHFVSDKKDTPTDPAGKFAEALRKLINEANKADTKILATEALKEFRDLHTRGHFPGLGYVKKLSMKHHMETMANFLNTHA